jgi:Arc/MetJ-type ribon-helix-helix transcriptional regulator
VVAWGPAGDKSTRYRRVTGVPAGRPVTISISDDLKDEVDGQPEYGDSRSEWIQNAIEMKLEQQGDAEDRSPADPVLAD